MKIICSEPSTFISTDSVLIIYDENGNPFFFHPNKEHAITFNLPKGIYTTKNRIEKQNVFIPYEEYVPLKYKFDPKSFKIIIADNPHKATINTQFKKITIDPAIYNIKYKPAIVFLLGHETAHLEKGGNIISGKQIIYNAEKECDTASKNYMLSHGWNPTQVKLSAMILKLNDPLRQQCIHDSTINQNFRR